MRADVVVQWQVARHRAKVSEGGPADLLGATWDPWWQFARGRRLPAACFRPRPSVDAAVLQITRRDPPAWPPEEFERYAAFVRDAWLTAADAPQIDAEWPSHEDRSRVSRQRQRRPSPDSRAPACTLDAESANMG